LSVAAVHDCGALNAVWRKCGKPTCAARPVTAATAAPAPEHEKRAPRGPRGDRRRRGRRALVPYSGWLYGCCAAGLGAWFLAEAHRLRGRVVAGGAQTPMRLFHLSIGYLTLLFAAIAVTALLPWGR
jgi:hypothetical protein